MRNLEKMIGKIADKADLAFLAYLEEADDEPTPTIRATAALREREGIRVFYLTASPQKAAGFRQEPRASLYLLAPGFHRGVCLSGTVEVLDGAESCMLKFTAKRGRYYTNFKSENFLIPD